jgi:hypothetical protein
MLKKIRFTASGASAAFGAFSPGDIASVSEEVAHHLVTDMQAASYDLAAPKAVAAEGKPARTEKRFTTTDSNVRKSGVTSTPTVVPPVVEK